MMYFYWRYNNKYWKLECNKYFGVLRYNKRDFFVRFINNGTEPFVRESDSHLAGFFYLYADVNLFIMDAVIDLETHYRLIDRQ